MFVFEEPSDSDEDWYLGTKKSSLGRISKNLLQCISNFDLLGIQFLFENFIKQRGGVILNEDEDMNMNLQVCTFLSSVKDKVSKESPVLIVCPDPSLCKWHYHITEVGFKPMIVASENLDPCEVYILTLESLKLSEKLANLDMFCIIVDELDTVVTKVIVRKMRGSFNIGLTKRNFYVNPDQKLKWAMLNWASPGCVGKLKDFYSIDRLHSLAFADNYRFWWLRLTWKYCASFEQPTDEIMQDYQQTLKEWGASHGIKTYFTVKDTKLKRKLNENRKQTEAKNRTSKPVKKARISKGATASFCKISLVKNTTSNSGVEEREKLDCAISESIERVVSDSLKKEDDVGTAAEVEEPKFLPKESEDTKIEDETQCNGFDILSVFENSSEIQNKHDLESDDENPIISIINSQQQPISTKTDNLLDIKKLLQSSDSDSEFLSDIVNNKNNSSRSYRSQMLSQVLDNLSDIEESKEKDSDEDNFFSELISGKKLKNVESETDYQYLHE